MESMTVPLRASHFKIDTWLLIDIYPTFIFLYIVLCKLNAESLPPRGTWKESLQSNETKYRASWGICRRLDGKRLPTWVQTILIDGQFHLDTAGVSQSIGVVNLTGRSWLSQGFQNCNSSKFVPWMASRICASFLNMFFWINEQVMIVWWVRIQVIIITVFCLFGRYPWFAHKIVVTTLQRSRTSNQGRQQ